VLNHSCQGAEQPFFTGVLAVSEVQKSPPIVRFSIASFPFLNRNPIRIPNFFICYIFKRKKDAVTLSFLTRTVLFIILILFYGSGVIELQDISQTNTPSAKEIEVEKPPPSLNLWICWQDKRKRKAQFLNQCKIFPRQNHQHTDLAGSEYLALADTISKKSIDLLTRLIKKIEAVIENRVELNPPYE
jgi:hypothetical protein